MTTTQTPATAKPQAPATRTATKLVGRIAEKYGVAPEALLATLRDTVFSTGKSKDGMPNAPFSDTELAAALILAEQYDLNPFAREIYVTRGQGAKLLVIVPVDGWSKVVNRRADYDGVDFEYLEGEGGKLKGVTCRMYVKGRRRPVEVTEWMSECYRDTGPWGSHPRRMLRHKAYIQAARIAFSLSGIMDDDEAARIVEGDVVTVRGALAGGRQPGYLPAPAIAPTLPTIQEVKAEPPVEEKEDVSARPASGDEAPGEERDTPEAALAPAISQASIPGVDEAGERRALWLEFCKLRPKLDAAKLKKVKEACSVATIEPSASLDLLTLALETAKALINGGK